MAITQEALRVLEETSRTFFIPIESLPKGLKEAVASGYLCMRAVDEIEDHPDPIHEAGSELVWIESREYITYGVMRGYAVWQLKEAA